MFLSINLRNQKTVSWVTTFVEEVLPERVPAERPRKKIYTAWKKYLRIIAINL